MPSKSRSGRRARRETVAGVTSLLNRAGDSAVTELVGRSMEPTIPNGTRVRIDFDTKADAREGDVVVVTTRTGYVIHRVVACWHRGRTRYVLTRGDARWMPDTPVLESELAGVVSEIEGPEGWVPTPRQHLNPAPPWVATPIVATIRYLSALHPAFGRLIVHGGGLGRAVLRRLVRPQRVPTRQTWTPRR